MESPATRHSAVSAFTETVEFLERSLASMLMKYCCSMIGCYFFLDIIGSQKRIATNNNMNSILNLSFVKERL